MKEAIEKNNLYLTKEDLHEYEGCDYLNTTENLYVIKLKKRNLVVKREGKCEPKKCKSVCCKFCTAGFLTDYSRGFFQKDEFGKEIVKIKCNNLSKCGKCKIWKKLPAACKQFPHPSDSIYWNVMDVCTFKFKILYIFYKNSDRIRDEMVLNFQEQNRNV